MVKNLDRLFRGLDDSDELLEMLAEEGDESGLEDLQRDIDELEKIVAGVPAKRLGTPEEIADLAVYIAGATYTSGQAFAIDGGWTI